MPSLNMPVQRLQVAILPLDLLCSGSVIQSREILTTDKSHGKKPDKYMYIYIYIYIYIYMCVFVCKIPSLYVYTHNSMCYLKISRLWSTSYIKIYLRQRKITNYKHINDKLRAYLILGVLLTILFTILWHFVCCEQT